MRHGNKLNHLSRKSAHRKALLANLATSLIVHKRISTTVAKAKALKKYIEPLITKAKEDTTHHRRTVFSYLNHKEPIKELFGVVADKIADRPGGYTRILRTGNRLGDNAETCIIELVDFNETYIKKDTKKGGKKKTRRGGTKTETIEATETVQPKAKTPKAEKKVAAAPVVEDVVETEVISDAVVISEPEVIAEAEVITEPEVVAEVDVIFEPEVVAEAEVINEPEVVAEAEVISEPVEVAEVTEEVIETPEVIAEAPEATAEEPEATETEEDKKDK
jgi:large subunit ribosomal protein L17